MTMEECLERYPELIDGIAKAIVREELKYLMGSSTHNHEKYMRTIPGVLRDIAEKIEQRYKDSKDGRNRSH